MPAISAAVALLRQATSRPRAGGPMPRRAQASSRSARQVRCRCSAAARPALPRRRPARVAVGGGGTGVSVAGASVAGTGVSVAGAVFVGVGVAVWTTGGTVHVAVGSPADVDVAVAVGSGVWLPSAEISPAVIVCWPAHEADCALVATGRRVRSMTRLSIAVTLNMSRIVRTTCVLLDCTEPVSRPRTSSNMGALAEVTRTAVGCRNRKSRFRRAYWPNFVLRSFEIRPDRLVRDITCAGRPG